MISEIAFVCIIVVGVSVTLASLFVFHLMEFIKLTSEMSTFHHMSLTNRDLFFALQREGRVISSDQLKRRQRCLFWSTLGCAMWWSTIIGYVAVQVLGA